MSVMRGGLHFTDKGEMWKRNSRTLVADLPVSHCRSNGISLVVVQVTLFSSSLTTYTYM